MADHPKAPGSPRAPSYPEASSEGRSANMRAIRRTDTKPELALRRALHRMGYRFRKDYRLDLDAGKRVRPDIAFTARKVAVFVDGCFWHACPDHGSKPSVNQGYWAPKLAQERGTGPRGRFGAGAGGLAGGPAVGARPARRRRRRRGHRAGHPQPRQSPQASRRLTREPGRKRPARMPGHPRTCHTHDRLATRA